VPTISLNHTTKPSLFSEEGAEAQVDARMMEYGQIVPGYLLHGGEIVILALKPSLWFLVLVSVRWLLAAALVILLAPWFVKFYPAFSDRVLTQSALTITAIRLIIALLQWSSRLYVLTNRRVMSCRGVTQVRIFEAPLVEIRNTYVNIRGIEKFCDVGSIGFSLKESKRVDAWWDQISKPHDIHDQVRRAIEKALDSHLPY